jgi:protein gp37
MAQDSAIEWTDATWNPVTGCTKISPGCKNCYAHLMAGRLHAMGQARYRNNFGVTLQPDIIDQPLRWNQPRKIFVNSMSDLFHAAVPLDFIRGVFDVMGKAERHTFQILTKRSERLLDLAEKLPWHENIWMGVSVETEDYAFRIDDLRRTSAHIKFLSLEPLLGPLRRLNLNAIDWVIVGGESGPGARPMNPLWVIDIRNQCQKAGVFFFFKQWGGVRKKQNGRILDGKTYDGFPACPPSGKVQQTARLAALQEIETLYASEAAG